MLPDLFGRTYQKQENKPKRGKNTKMGKIYQNGENIPKWGKYTKWHINRPNGRKIDQITINMHVPIPTSSITGPSKTDSNLDFWF
jgi:hypothetical protein